MCGMCPQPSITSSRASRNSGSAASASLSGNNRSARPQIICTGIARSPSSSSTTTAFLNPPKKLTPQRSASRKNACAPGSSPISTVSSSSPSQIQSVPAASIASIRRTAATLLRSSSSPTSGSVSSRIVNITLRPSEVESLSTIRLTHFG